MYLQSLSVHRDLDSSIDPLRRAQMSISGDGGLPGFASPRQLGDTVYEATPARVNSVIIHNLDGDSISDDDEGDALRSPLDDLVDPDGLLDGPPLLTGQHCITDESMGGEEPTPAVFVVVDPVPTWMLSVTDGAASDRPQPVVADTELLQRVQQLFLADGGNRLAISVVDVHLSEASRSTAPFALYIVEIRSGLRTWVVQRRYREFAALHRCLECCKCWVTRAWRCLGKDPLLRCSPRVPHATTPAAWTPCWPSGSPPLSNSRVCSL